MAAPNGCAVTTLTKPCLSSPRYLLSLRLFIPASVLLAVQLILVCSYFSARRSFSSRQLRSGCNIIVSTTNSLRYLKSGLLRPRLLVPHSLLAIPCAYLGGRVHLDKFAFQILIASALLIAAINLLRSNKSHHINREYKNPSALVNAGCGCNIGFFIRPNRHRRRASSSRRCFTV